MYVIKYNFYGLYFSSKLKGDIIPCYHSSVGLNYCFVFSCYNFFSPGYVGQLHVVCLLSKPHLFTRPWKRSFYIYKEWTCPHMLQLQITDWPVLKKKKKKLQDLYSSFKPCSLKCRPCLTEPLVWGEENRVTVDAEAEVLGKSEGNLMVQVPFFHICWYSVLRSTGTHITTRTFSPQLRF